MNKAQLVSLIIFVLSYLLFVFLPHRRTLIAIIGSLLLVVLGALSFRQAWISINWNVMGIFVGTLAIADVFMKSRVPAYLAEIIVNKTKNTAWSILWICALTGFISAFVENVATVLIIAPVALAIAKKLNFNPTRMMIAIAISSNLQGTATLIGDPPSMLLGGFAKMNFGDFFFYHGKPSIFFAVELGALASFLVLYFIFKEHREKTELIRTEKVNSWVPTIILVGMILLLAGSSFVSPEISHLPGLVCVLLGVVALFWQEFTHQEKITKSITGLDWDTSIFLVGVFILVGSLTLNGWVDKLALFLSGLVGGNIFLGYTLIVFFSVFVSGFVDNVPFLAAMLPVAIKMSENLNIAPPLLLFGLLIGASLGGNLTPIGASANIVACGILKKEGHPVKFGEFFRLGFPFTMVAVTFAYLFIWLVWR